MAHEHGPHGCYCPFCGNEIIADVNIKCNTVACPVCGARMRAVETGERRVSDQVSSVIAIDDQPVNSTFFGEGRWLTDFVTPDAFDVKNLYDHLTDGIDDVLDRIHACWKWVASQIKYVKFVRGKVWIAGKSSWQNDLWLDPNMTIQVERGNCATKSFLLTSLLRNELSTDQVFCALGNLYNGKPGGHAWVKLNIDGEEYYTESTRHDIPFMVLASAAKRYEAVHYFNDKTVYAVEGRTQLWPYTACFSSWLSSYLHWAYIRGQGSD